MSEKYVLDRAPEIERLERQAALIGLDRVRDHLPTTDIGTVLDAGCGSGWVSRLIAREKPGATVTGIDITTEFVDYAARRAKEEGLAGLSYLTGDITDLPFEDESFDFVWSQLVVFFLPDPEAALTEFARVLRPGGQVKVAVTDGPFESIWPERQALSSGVRDFRETVMHGWRMARVPQMLKSAGFQNITIETAVDRVHSFDGGASPAQRRNIEESYIHAIQAQPHLSGGRDQADRLVGELIDFIDDPASTAINTHWVFGGRRSQG
jgi:SAM-dependent methyltransferase